MQESKKTTRKRLGSVKSKNTKPEVIVRKYLHNRGYRFRIAKKELPGKPDIVLPKYNSVIFVNGCFWHRHDNCKKTTIPKKNIEFWKEKFENNKKRDQKNYEKLKETGWKVHVIWECDILMGHYEKKIILQLNSNILK